MKRHHYLSAAIGCLVLALAGLGVWSAGEGARQKRAVWVATSDLVTAGGYHCQAITGLSRSLSAAALDISAAEPVELKAASFIGKLPAPTDAPTGTVVDGISAILDLRAAATAQQTAADDTTKSLKTYAAQIKACGG